MNNKYTPAFFSLSKRKQKKEKRSVHTSQVVGAERGEAEMSFAYAMAAASPSSLLLPTPQTLSRPLLNGRLPSPPATRRAPSLPFWSPTRDPRRFAASSSPAPSAVEGNPKLDAETGGRSAKDKEEGLREQRVVLPTNESSEKLLRIRHTVLLFLLTEPFLLPF